MTNLIDDFYLLLNSSLKSVTLPEIFQKKIKVEKDRILIENFLIDLNQFKEIFVIGFGKASASMATEIEKYLYNRVEKGIVITKYGFKTETNKIRVYEAGHPIPDENTIKYSNEILNLLTKTKEDDLVICLISGGGSSLFEVPDNIIDLYSLQRLNDFLTKQRISIHQINYFRKAFSNVKGGKLLKYIYPSTCLSLIISDVVGDDLSIIASGPTYLTETELNILEKDRNNITTIISNQLSFNSLQNLIYENKRPSYLIDYFKSKVYNFIVASNSLMINNLISEAKRSGYETVSVNYNFSDSVEELCKKFINDFYSIIKLNSKFRKIIVYGGETFLEVKGNGKGGRNTHLILSILNEILNKNLEIDSNFLIASFATDGNDGNTDAAGAFITNEILNEIRSSNLSVTEYLDEFNSYHFFEKFNCLIKTGPTFTNVADVFICLINKE